MERSEIIDGVVDLLRLHNDGLRGTIHQEPYKGDFFKLFAAAMRLPPLSATERRRSPPTKRTTICSPSGKNGLTHGTAAPTLNGSYAANTGAS